MRIIFFIVFFGIFFAINYYVFIRGLRALPAESNVRYAYSVVFWILALAFIGGRFLENHLPSPVSEALIWGGSFWIAAAIYFLMAVIGLDFLRLINHFFPFLPSAVTENYPRAKQFTFMVITGIVALVLISGHVNSLRPKITSLTLSVPKKTARLQKLNIVVVSDVHMGTIVGRSRLDRIVEKINRMDADLVLLPGDIVDEDIRPVIRQNLGESLRNIKSRLGVYAVTGNHEYLGGVEAACAYLKEHNVVLLRDEWLKIADSIYLVGREDRFINRLGNTRRKSLSELMACVDKTYPVILMDHQPFDLEEAAAQSVDLYISGHTHAGQLWPFNYIVRQIYEVPWGYKKIGDMHVYVSTGVGTWGPPVRIGNRPEIVQMQVSFY